MSDKFVAITEHRMGKLKSISWETIGFAQALAQRLGKELNNVVLGHGVDELAQEISSRTGETVLMISHPNLANYTPEAYCEALVRLLSDTNAYLILMGHTYQVMDFAPRLAASFDRGFIPNCMDFQIERGQLIFVRQVFNGKLNLHVGLKGEPPYFVSLQQGAFIAYEISVKGTPRVVSLDLTVP